MPTRRQFLWGSALATAGLWLGRIPGLRALMPQPTPVDWSHWNYIEVMTTAASRVVRVNGTSFLRPEDVAKVEAFVGMYGQSVAMYVGATKVNPTTLPIFGATVRDLRAPHEDLGGWLASAESMDKIDLLGRELREPVLRSDGKVLVRDEVLVRDDYVLTFDHCEEDQ